MSAANQIRVKVLKKMTAGLIAGSIPVLVWWKYASDSRYAVTEEVCTRVRVRGVPTTDDLLLERVQAGDVVLFDRRCEKCASGPWAALACLAGRQFLCDDSIRANRTVEAGRFDHIGIVVPGYINTAQDEFDPTNLLLLEATASGIVTRPLKTRLEHTQSRSVLLLQLCSPGEKRNADDSCEQLPSVERTREFIEKELRLFRDRWTELGNEKQYRRFHSTVALGGAVAYGMGLQDNIAGPVSPSAYLVLMGLQQAAVAQNIKENDNRKVKVENFLRDYRFEEKSAVGLRPGFRFLAPVPVRETSRY